MRRDLTRNGYVPKFILNGENSITKPVSEKNVHGNEIKMAPSYIEGITEGVSKILKPYNVKLFSE